MNKAKLNQAIKLLQEAIKEKPPAIPARDQDGDEFIIENLYTVLIDGLLWTNVVDDMNSTESWGWGGIICLSCQAAEELIQHLKQYNEYKTFEIKTIKLY